jgi:hypothetical protein
MHAGITAITELAVKGLTVEKTPAAINGTTYLLFVSWK